MTRQEATARLHSELVKHQLTGWSVRLTNNPDSRFLGLCSYKDKCIILSSHHIDIHPTPDVVNTILHEVAHALCPGHGHDDTWSAKAREIGCDNTLPCSNLSLSPEIIDAIRSGATVEVTFEEHVIRTPKYNITRLQDKCEKCGKVAKQVKEKLIISRDETKPDHKLITLECGHMLLRKIPKGTPFHTFQAGGDPNCKHTWEKSKCVACGRKRMYPFQLEGAQFGEAALAVNWGVGIFDEMGLGKTVQAGAIVKFHPELWPVLWVVKSGLKYQFATFLLQWLGTEHCPWVVDTSKDWLPPGLKHYIVSYDMLVQKSRTITNKTTKEQTIVKSGFDITQFDRVGIKCVILDECQQIKNVDSGRTQAVRRVVKGRKVIALSGTPWNNRGSELYPVLNMLDHVKFWSEAEFKRVWVDYYYHGNQPKEGGIKPRLIEKFKEYTKDIIIRRERAIVMPELPLVNRTKLNIKMDPSDEAQYDAAVEDFIRWFEAQVDNVSGIHILAAMAKLRHLVGVAKMSATKEYIEEFIEDTDKKIVVFAHHEDVQSMLYHDMKEHYEGEEFIKENGSAIPVLRINAEMKPFEREQTARRFNELPRCIMVASQLAAGEGINLQTCADCIMHERMWNPGKEEQCEGRFPRPGSTADQINAIYAHLDGMTAIDSQLDAIVERKRLQFHAVHNKGQIIAWSEDAIGKELAHAIINAHKLKKARKSA